MPGDKKAKKHKFKNHQELDEWLLVVRQHYPDLETKFAEDWSFLMLLDRCFWCGIEVICLLSPFCIRLTRLSRERMLRRVRSATDRARMAARWVRLRFKRSWNWSLDQGRRRLRYCGVCALVSVAKHDGS